jgi:hypothetical protein
MVKKWLVLHGGSTEYRSPYATTSALSYGRGANISQRPPASPWMGDHMSRHGYMSSGYQSSYFRDKPPGTGELHDTSEARGTFSRPKTATLEETQPWTGEKDAPHQHPLTSCLRRGETKEPRFYPFKIGSEHGAHALISPPEADSSVRFQAPPSVFKGGQINPNATILKQRGMISSGFSIGNSQPLTASLITAPQGQAEFHSPALTMREAERVAADSTRRYFHARDYYENPFMSSNNYYQNDVLAQHEEMKRKKESLTSVPSTRPLTQYALAHNEAPYAPDVGDGIALPIKRIGEGVEDAWGKVPPESDRVGLMPTAFSRVEGLTKSTGSTGEELKPAPPLPERFARIRARHDYLKWGGTSSDADRFLSTSRVELCKPAAQHPPGGPINAVMGGAKIVATDSSGYHFQITADPITHDVGL